MKPETDDVRFWPRWLHVQVTNDDPITFTKRRLGVSLSKVSILERQDIRAPAGALLGRGSLGLGTHRAVIREPTSDSFPLNRENLHLGKHADKVAQHPFGIEA